MRVGVADHLGWAVVVTASDEHRVVDRRRIGLVEPGVASAPIHHEGKGLDDSAAAALVAEVRASALRATSSALDVLADDPDQQIVSMSIRALPSKFPDDIATLRRVPYESRADAVMYRRVLAELARARGWDLHFFSAKTVLGTAERILGRRADEVLHGPRQALGPPWTKDHRMALAATILANHQESSAMDIASTLRRYDGKRVAPFRAVAEAVQDAPESTPTTTCSTERCSTGTAATS